MTQKQKISDLPKQEQEKIIAQMKELGIKGIYATFSVEKAHAAIEKALNEQKQEQEQEQEKPQEQEQPKEQEQEEKQEQKQEEKPQPKQQKQAKPLKCHICLSPVIDGKCTGCGFTLQR